MSAQTMVNNEYFKERKKIQRNNDAGVFNGLVYLLCSSSNVTVEFIKSKSTSKSIKLWVPKTISLENGQKLNTAYIKDLGVQFLQVDRAIIQNKLSYKNNEALINAGLIKLLLTLGFDIKLKKGLKERGNKKIVFPFLRIEYVNCQGRLHVKDEIMEWGMKLNEIVENSLDKVVSNETVKGIEIEKSSTASIISYPVVINEEFDDSPTFELKYHYLTYK